MTVEPLTVRAPRILYARLEERAQKTQRSVEEEIVEALAEAVPLDNVSLPADVAAAVAALDAMPDAARQRVARQARYRCGYCLTAEEVAGAAMQVDHMFPEALGGLTVEENLWLACSDGIQIHRCRRAGRRRSLPRDMSGATRVLYRR